MGRWTVPSVAAQAIGPSMRWLLRNGCCLLAFTYPVKVRFTQQQETRGAKRSKSAPEILGRGGSAVAFRQLRQVADDQELEFQLIAWCTCSGLSEMSSRNWRSCINSKAVRQSLEISILLDKSWLSSNGDWHVLGPCAVSCRHHLSLER
jgi:hypothetical protein